MEIKKHKSWLPTYTGRVVDIMEPKPGMVDVHDIAHALSMTCRFGGHCRDFYSVAEHSLLVLDIGTTMLAADPTSFPNDVSHDHLMALFLHDAAEAYVGDLISPIKENIPKFRDLEQKWLAAIDTHFNLGGALAIPSERFKSIVKVADTRALAIEVVSLYPSPNQGWWQRFTPPSPGAVCSHAIECLYPSQARLRFLQVFFELEGRRGNQAPWQRIPRPEPTIAAKKTR